MRVFRTILLTLLCLNCSRLTQPDYSLAEGVYALERVDGMVLPVPFETGDCPREMYEGDLSLARPSGEQETTFYSLLVSLRLRCDPSRLLFVDLREAVRDVGEWTVSDGRVVFESYRGFGDYRVPIEPAPAGGQIGIVLTLPFNGRRYTFRRLRLPSAPPLPPPLP
jgi:hypothetical protein